jgi:hypothetical protein
MRFIKACLVSSIVIAMVLGCAPKRLPEGEEEKVPLSKALTETLRKYRGVTSLQAQLFLKLDVREEFHLLRGVLLYKRPGQLRLRLTSAIGGTVAEVVYNEGLLSILLPSKGKIFMGRTSESDPWVEDTLVLKMAYKDYADTAGGRFPTRIYGEVEGEGISFELRLKQPRVNVVLPQEVFSPTTAGWKIHPLADLKKLVSSSGVEKTP